MIPRAARWGPLTPQNWPQQNNQVPSAMADQMPHVEAANASRSRQESFTMSGSFSVLTTTAAGQVLGLYLATDQDGDFWCDQISMLGWFGSGGALVNTMTRPRPSTLSIQDARTGRRLTYPDAIPTNFLTTIVLFADEPGFDPSVIAYPDGFRSTATLAQPFCFTRAGGIQLALTMLVAGDAAQVQTVDIVFSGWKEYEYASTAK